MVSSSPCGTIIRTKQVEDRVPGFRGPPRPLPVPSSTRAFHHTPQGPLQEETDVSTLQSSQSSSEQYGSD